MTEYVNPDHAGSYVTVQHVCFPCLLLAISEASQGAWFSDFTRVTLRFPQTKGWTAVESGQGLCSLKVWKASHLPGSEATDYCQCGACQCLFNRDHSLVLD